MSKVKIFFIYAEKCKHCQSALDAIQNAITKCNKISCEIIKIIYNSDVAVKIAIEHDIDDLPGFVIGKEAFKGHNYDESAIVRAIRKAVSK